MGTRVRMAIGAFTDAHLEALARKCQQHLQYLRNPISISLCVLSAEGTYENVRALQLVAFRDRDVDAFATVPPVLVERLRLQVQPEKVSFLDRLLRKAPTNDAAAQSKEAFQELQLTPELFLSCLASEVAGTSYFTEYSDGSCSSAFVEFRDGKAVRGSAYGVGGSEVLLTFADGIASASIQTLGKQYEDYGEPLRTGLQELFGQDADLEDSDGEGYLEVFVETARWVLLEKKEMVSPPRREDVIAT